MAAERSDLQIEQVTVESTDPLLFRLVGELDLGTVDRLRAAVGPACGTGREVLLDLSRLSFCDSTGVGTFVWLHRQATAAGGRLLLAAPRRQVREVLKISGVDRAIPVLGRNALIGRSPVAPRRASGQTGPAPG
jgi:anti-sigma B factor antagonist